MERRLFLAIGLSLIVVWLWSAVAPKPQSRPEPLGILQHTENKEDIEEQENFRSPSPTPNFSTEPSTENKTNAKSVEKTETLGSEKLEAEFSSIGATLNKITIREYNTSFPLQGVTGISGYENLPFNLDRVGENDIEYSYETDEFKIVKTYRIPEGDYIVESGIEFHNKTNMSKLIDLSINSYVLEMSNLNGKEEKESPANARDKSLNEYVVNGAGGIYRKAGAFKFSSKEKREEPGEVLWSGFRNRYFCALVKPQYDTGGYTVDPLGDTQLRVGIKAKPTTILPESSARLDSIIYAGPEKVELLQEYRLGFEKIRKYYRFGLFDSIAMIIDGLMRLIHKVVPNWGICIILISIIIYFSMYPLTLRSMVSMKKMQSLQPHIVKLKEKYKDNPQKMNKEMMGLYKEHKVNPLGGCLPMLLQMPVFIGLYQVLWRSVEFKGAHFLWIKDLSEPDRLFILPFSMPFLGNEFNLLPVIMIVVMFFQQKLSAKNMVISSPEQAAQQKMMMTIMPVFLGFIFYKFASGLTLYFTMFYFFSTFTQWKMSKKAKVE